MTGNGTMARFDPRARRREIKRRGIVAEAWLLAERDGLGAISLRDLADRVDLRQPSLYAYFDSKLALYDAMFADANEMLLSVIRGLPALHDPRAALVQFARACVEFSSRHIVRHQLMFDRTIPGFEPSATAFEPAIEFHRLASEFLAATGPVDEADGDVFSGLISGLAHQQVANDPGGDRWVRLIPRTVDMFLADLDRRRRSGGSST